MTHTDNQAQVGMHVFERAGLGKAPFAVTGFGKLENPHCPEVAGGSCDYCGTGILYAAFIRSRDGRSFKVGSDCVAKTDDAGLIKSYKQRPEVRAMARAKRKAKDDRIIAEWNTLMSDPANVEKLSAIMVPGRPWIPGEQVTLYENLKRIWRMCGATGRARMLKTLKSKLAA